MHKAIVSVGIVLVVAVSTAACTTNSSNKRDGYVSVVQYGYYDVHHHYHYYDYPRKVRVKNSEYKAHMYQYQPHGTQHAVSIPKTIVPKSTPRKTTHTSRC